MLTLSRATSLLALAMAGCVLVSAGEEALVLMQARASLVHGDAAKEDERPHFEFPDAVPKKLELSQTGWASVSAYKYLMLDTHADPSRKLLFCMIPKNACTEFLSLILRMDGFTDQHWNPTAYGDLQAAVHGDETRESMFWLQHDMTLEENVRKLEFESRMDGTDGSGYQRAVFLRDPVHRLLSAYTTKVQTGMYKEANKGYPVALPETISFEAFVDILDEHGVTFTGIDPHIRAQSELCGLNETLPYMSFVGDFDKLDEDARRMVTLVGGSRFASEMLDDGWGPNRTQSLFGVPRNVREAGATRGFMPVTEGNIAGITALNVNSVGATYVREEAVLETEGSYYSNTRSEQEFVEKTANRLKRDNPELVARIQKLYAADYALIAKYLPGKSAAGL